jgi:hypothetical protein
MSPQSTNVAMVSNHDRQLNLPGSTGFQVTVWSENGGNITKLWFIWPFGFRGEDSNVKS